MKLGYDLQQAIRAGAGLDDLLVDRISMVDPTLNWPSPPSLEFDISTPPVLRPLARHGRPPGLWIDPSDSLWHRTVLNDELGHTEWLRVHQLAAGEVDFRIRQIFPNIGMLDAV